MPSSVPPAIDIVVNLHTPAEVQGGLTGLDDNFHDQVRISGDVRRGVPVDDCLRRMDRAGIERSLLIATRAGDLRVRGSCEIPYARVAEVCAAHPDRFSGLAGIDPMRGMQQLRFAVLVGVPTLRLRGHYLALATVRFNATVLVVVSNAGALTGGYGGLSGSLYAHYAHHISPGDFDAVRSITLLVMLITGGETSVPGAVLGSVLVSFLPEWLRFLGDGYLAVFGIGVLLVLVLMPAGITGLVRQMFGTRGAARA